MPAPSPTIARRSGWARKEAYSYQNRGGAKQALGDLDGALADINQAIRLDPTLPQPLINRTAIWRAKNDLDRAIADGSEAIRLAKDKPPVNIMTPPNSVLISAYTHRALAYEARGDFEHAKDRIWQNRDRRACRLRRRQQGQPGHRQGAAVAAVGPCGALAVAADRTDGAVRRGADGDIDAGVSRELRCGAATGCGGPQRRQSASRW